MCTVLLPPGGNPIAVKYIVSYHIISYIMLCISFCCMFNAGSHFNRTYRKLFISRFPSDHFINKWEMSWFDSLTNVETFLKRNWAESCYTSRKIQVGSLNKLFPRINEITSTELQILCRALTGWMCGPYVFVSESCFSSYLVRHLTASRFCRDVNHLKLLPWKWMTCSLVPVFKLSALLARIN
jgi:hypothetical protein